MATLAAELDVPVQIHLHETAGEVLQAVEANGERPLDTLHRLGLLGPRTQCVHMTDLGDQDIALLAATGAHVVHCPQSNMKLASGTCPVSLLQDAGVNVALGTDSAASNNDLNLFGEMQAALRCWPRCRPATPPPCRPPEALAMATINGAAPWASITTVGSVETRQAGRPDRRRPVTAPRLQPRVQPAVAAGVRLQRQPGHPQLDRLASAVMADHEV